MNDGFCAVESPTPSDWKSQDQDVGVPVDESVNITVRGAVPLTGAPVKFTAGMETRPAIDTVAVPVSLPDRAVTVESLSSMARVRTSVAIPSPLVRTEAPFDRSVPVVFEKWTPAPDTGRPSL